MGISKFLADSIQNYHHQGSIGSKLRAKRIAPMLKLIEQVYREKGQVNIIDIGGTAHYWGIIPENILRSHKVSVTVLNLPTCKSSEDYGVFKHIAGDACDMHTIADNSFDIAHSNSVIEHVGDWGRMNEFAREIERVATHYFVQTPNYWFPVEPHYMMPFFHWLPKPTRVWLVMQRPLGHLPQAKSVDEAVRNVEGGRLLNHKMFKALFPEAEIITEWFLGLPKSFIALKSKRHN